ncbi:hypothetical protein C8Q80DRAFT_1275284 [Daedaleopsis nitida]|nr:hypothetical protein C8Q80DRAFT_1275284 [Daedaleopsis nitida]
MAETSSRPLKRARVEDEAADPENLRVDWDDSILRDRDLWLDDGNIILVAGKTAFKVYKGLLAVQSPVFAGMLAASSPDATTRSEGTPVVHLPDSPTDLKHLLHTLLPTKDVDIFRRTDNDGYDFERLFSVTRLAHKYEIEIIEQQAIDCLKVYFTHRFSFWEDAKQLGIVALNEYLASIGVVHLARLTGNLSMLPIALYDCALTRGRIARGWHREDGTVERLSDGDLERCIDGFGTLCREWTDMSHQIHSTTPSQMCLTREACRESLLDLREQAADNQILWEPLSPTLSIRSPHCEPTCPSCTSDLLKRDSVARHALWRRLPTIFGLEVEGWDQL